jgi:hypothetical protein
MRVFFDALSAQYSLSWCRCLAGKCNDAYLVSLRTIRRNSELGERRRQRLLLHLLEKVAPDEGGVAGAERIGQIAAASPAEHVICLASGPPPASPWRKSRPPRLLPSSASTCARSNAAAPPSWPSAAAPSVSPATASCWRTTSKDHFMPWLLRRRFPRDGVPLRRGPRCRREEAKRRFPVAAAARPRRESACSCAGGPRRIRWPW